MRIHVIHTDAQDHSILLRIFVDVALKVVGFDGAARREILGVKIKDHPLALELIKRNLSPFLAGQAESRGLIADSRRLRLICCTRKSGSQYQSREKCQENLHNAPFELAIMINENDQGWPHSVCQKIVSTRR